MERGMAVPGSGADGGASCRSRCLVSAFPLSAEVGALR